MPDKEDDPKKPQPLVTGPIVGLIAVLLTLGLIGYVLSSLWTDGKVNTTVAFGLMAMIIFTLGGGSKFWPGGG